MTSHALDTWIQLAQLQLWQVTWVAAIGGAAAAWIARSRPHLAQVLLLIVLLKCLTPPGIASPTGLWWQPIPTGWVTAGKASLPSIMPLPSETKESAQVSDSISEIVGPSVPSAPTTKPSIHALNRIWIWLAVGWLSIAGVLCLVATIRWHVARRAWIRTGVAVPARLGDIVRRLRDSLGIRQLVDVNVNQAQYGPLVAGSRRPSVVLPEGFVASASQSDLEFIVAHELIHWRRGDTWLSLLQWVTRSIWWFHPLIWWVNRQLDRTCEQCCDDAVIGSLRCSPQAYAGCLLHIVEWRHAVRHVGWTPGSRPAAITARRLRRLLQPRRVFPTATPVYCWCILVVLVAVCLPSQRVVSAPQSSDDHTTSNDPDNLSADGTSLSRSPAAAAFQARDWEAAANGYQDVVALQPKNAIAWLRLGYARHALGCLDEAISAYRQASGFPETRPTALYNLACAYCLQGNAEESLKTMRQAIDNGYRSQTPMEDDGDLAALRDDPRFRELASQAVPPQRQPMYRALDFQIGTWTVVRPDGTPLGRSVITGDEQGFLLTEKWHTNDGMTGTAINFFDPSQQQWKMTYVGGLGNVIQLAGKFQDGSLQLSGSSAFPNGRTAQIRATTTPLPQGGFEFVMQTSRDGGSTWETSFDGVYRRHPSRTQYPK